MVMGRQRCVVDCGSDLSTRWSC